MNKKRKDQASRLREIAGKDIARKHVSGYPTVITVTSGKGGVGKSTVALNIALKICDFGKKVLLFDADTNLANLDVLLGISPEYRLGNVLRGELAVEEALSSPHPNLYFLAGSSGDKNYPKTDASVQEFIIKQLAEVRYPIDFVLVDTSAGLTDEVVNYSLHSDESIIVTNSEPTSIMDAYAMIKMIMLVRAGHRIGIVVNSAKSASEAEETARTLQMAVNNFLNCSVDYLGCVPHDLNVQKSVSQRHALVQLYPGTRAAVSLQQLAHKIVFENNVIQERSLSTV